MTKGLDLVETVDPLHGFHAACEAVCFVDLWGLEKLEQQLSTA